MEEKERELEREGVGEREGVETRDYDAGTKGYGRVITRGYRREREGVETIGLD